MSLDCGEAAASPPQDGLDLVLTTRRANKVIVVEKEAVFQVSGMQVA